MIRHLRLLSPTVLHSASIGGIAGIVFAAREIAAHDYLRHHLWRTALWIASRDTAFGALLGSVASALMLLSLAAWQARLPSAGPDAGASSASPPPAVTPGLLRRFAAFFAACSAAAVLLMPAEAPQAFGLSHWYLVAACLALAWIVVRSSAVEASLSADRGAPSLQFALLWSVAVTLAYVLGLAHLWARAWPGWITACAACAGLLAALALYAALRRPVRWLAERLGGVVPARLPGGLRFAAVLTMICLAVLWACGLFVGRRTRAWAAASGTNIIVIAVDTLRWDATSLLSPDEHERDCTPNTRRLLTPRSTVFTHAYSQSAWTLPSFGSIFTGLYPEQHGGEHVWSRLRLEQTTLAEILRDRGYQTMAVVSGHYVTGEVGMLQGFGTRDETMALGGAAITSQGVTDRALALIEAADPDRPFFLFAHYFDPHYPYLAHREVDLGPTGADRPAPTERGPRPFPPGGGEPGRGGFAFSADRSTYDEEVAYVDLHIGRLLTFLEERRLWDNTCVVLVSDHGEEFREHGGTGHDNTLFEELVRVPLSLAAPGIDLPDVVPEPVEIRWLFGALLEIGGIRSSANVPDDASLLAPGSGADQYVRSSTCPRGRAGVEGSTRPSVWLSSLAGERYKLIEDHLHGRTMLFDLLEDPRELQNLSDELPEVSRPLAQALALRDAPLFGAGEAGPAPRISEDEVRRLKDLGYL